MGLTLSDAEIIEIDIFSDKMDPSKGWFAEISQFIYLYKRSFALSLDHMLLFLLKSTDILKLQPTFL